MAKWIVNHNIAGYMPDNDPIVCNTRKEAVSVASEEARRIRDDNNEYDTRRYTKAGSDGDYWIDCADPNHLPTHVWIAQISDEEAADWIS